MERKDDVVYAGHMLDSARQARRLLGDRTRAEFDGDPAVSLAVTHLLQVIGEAARRVSRAFTDAHPEVPWRAIVGMRHRIVHDYLYVDFDIVWDVATKDLPALIRSLEAIVEGKEK